MMEIRKLYRVCRKQENLQKAKTTKPNKHQKTRKICRSLDSFFFEKNNSGTFFFVKKAIDLHSDAERSFQR